MAVPTIGELSYNGLSFDAYHSTTVRSTPIPDTSGRTIKYVKYELHITARVTGSRLGAADTAMTQMKQLLQRKGGRLSYVSHGYGDVIVNDRIIGVYDVNHGPTPTLGVFKPYPGAPGSPPSAYVEWTVEFTIPACPPGKKTLYEFGLAELCYTMEYAIDSDGWTTITCAGDLEIPLTTFPGHTLTDNAEKYRERINYPCPVGFQRTTQDFRLSADRKRLDFTITDKELPIALPVGATMADVRHRTRGQLGRQRFSVWEASFSGTVRMNPAWGKSSAYERFMSIVMQRINRTPQFRAQSPGAESRIIITGLEIEEEIFNYTSRFSLNYTIMGTPLKAIISLSGLWQPVDALNFQDWSKSLRDNAHHIRGNGRYAYKSALDVLVDLCVTPPKSPKPQPPTTPRSMKPLPGVVDPPKKPPLRGLPQPQPNNPFGLPAAIQAGPAGGGAGRINVPPRTLSPAELHDVDPESSWLSYELTLALDVDHHTARHVPLTGKILEQKPKLDALGSAAKINADTAPARLNLSTNRDELIQRIAPGSATVTLSGSATRLGFEINPPRLITYEGMLATLARERLVGGVLTSVAGIPVHALAWEFTYLLPRPPKTHKNPANPLLGVDGDG